MQLIELTAEERDGMRFQRQSRGAVIGKNFLAAVHRGQFQSRFVVLHLVEQRQFAVLVRRAQCVPQRRAAIQMQRAEGIGAGQPGNDRRGSAVCGG